MRVALTSTIKSLIATSTILDINVEIVEETQPNKILYAASLNIPQYLTYALVHPLLHFPSSSASSKLDFVGKQSRREESGDA